ncbi:MAG: carboxypeptidase regulatory-like domain-containing protein [Bacteroidota bacterium]|nr:carboxypeptidase regulatory-like domain-containing protein [Bacteroidota bacterium]
MLKKITIFALLFLFVGVAMAQLPAAPTNLTVEKLNNPQSFSYAKLQWEYSIMNFQFIIYKAVNDRPFVKIAVTRMLHFVDPMVPPGHIYRYYVTAIQNNLNESLPSNEVVFVPDSTPPPPNMVRGFISGNIINDSTAEPIGGVRLRFYKLNGWMYWREARTDSFGNYFAPLDTGTFLVYASKWTYIPEWFDNSLTRENATPVSITVGDTSTANFGLKRVIIPPPPVWVSVSGTVIDSVALTPLNDAHVLFMRTNRTINMAQNQDGYLFGNREELMYVHGFGTISGIIGKARTDENGNYTVRVPAGFSYIALAVKLGYIPEFYNNKLTPFDADKITIVGDTSGINFDLVLNPDTQNSLTGKVKNELSDGVMSKVVLFQKVANRIMPVRYTVSDTLGNYAFNFLNSGYYLAKAYPLAFYAPAWYDADSCGIFCWANADSFMVDGNTTGIDICVLPIPTSGFASILGTVNVIGKNNIIQGVTVYAVSLATNSIVSYDITEEDGKFELSNLAPGSYKVVVDKEGYNAVSTPVYSVSSENNYTEENAQILISSATLGIGGNDNLPDKYSLNQNYPNPFNPTTEISFAIPKMSKVNITVYNLLGQQITTLLNGELNTGNYSVVWNGTDTNGRIVGSSVYFYKITANSLDNSLTFSSVKKMLLVK